MSKIRETLNAAEKSNADIATIFRMVPKSLNDHLVDLKNLKDDVEKLIKELSKTQKERDVLSKKLEVLTAELDAKEKEIYALKLKAIEPEIIKQEPSVEVETEITPPEPAEIVEVPKEKKPLIPDEVNLSDFHYEIRNGKYHYGTISTSYTATLDDIETIFRNLPEQIDSANEVYGNRKRVSALMKLLYSLYGGELFTVSKRIHYRKPK